MLLFVKLKYTQKLSKASDIELTIFKSNFAKKSICIIHYYLENYMTFTYESVYKKNYITEPSGMEINMGSKELCSMKISNQIKVEIIT